MRQLQLDKIAIGDDFGVKQLHGGLSRSDLIDCGGLPR